MTTCAQQITWHLKRAVLEQMLDEAAGDYSALEFKMCITQDAETKWLVRLIAVDLSASHICDGTVLPRTADDQEICPVPPDCNRNPNFFKSVLAKYYEANEITFEIPGHALAAAFQ